MKLKFAIFVFSCAALAAALTAAMMWRARLVEAELAVRMASGAERLQVASDRRDYLREALRRKSSEPIEEKNALLRLRADVSELRRGATDVDLNDALDRLKREVAGRTNNATDPGPDPSKVRAYWAKDQMAFAGQASQPAAVQSALWALSGGDTNAIVSAMVPDIMKELATYSTPNPTEKDRQGTSEAAIRAIHSRFETLAESLRPVTGFYLVSEDLIPKMPELVRNRHAEDYAIYKVYFAGEGATRGVFLKRFNDQWKLAGIYGLGGTEEQPRYEMTLWP